jgi:hypothetical protein
MMGAVKPETCRVTVASSWIFLLTLNYRDFIHSLLRHTFAQQHRFQPKISQSSFSLKFGFSDSYVNWFHSFLPKRQFLVLISGIPLSCFKVLSGTAQGNVIGLFPLNMVVYEMSLSTKYTLLSLMILCVSLNYQTTALCNVLYCNMALIPQEVVALVT